MFYKKLKAENAKLKSVNIKYQELLDEYQAFTSNLLQTNSVKDEIIKAYSRALEALGYYQDKNGVFRPIDIEYDDKVVPLRKNHELH